MLDIAYPDHPERFVNKRPTTPELPSAVWINPPARPGGPDQQTPLLLTDFEEQVAHKPSHAPMRPFG